MGYITLREILELHLSVFGRDLLTMAVFQKLKYIHAAIPQQSYSSALISSNLAWTSVQAG